MACRAGQLAYNRARRKKRKLHRAAQGGNIHEKAGSRMRSDREKWRQLVKAAGIKMEE
jgi:hypothetical protein